MPVTLDLPDSARLAWWLTAWLRGTASPDDALTVVLGDDAAHQVVGLDPAEQEPSGLVAAVGALRRLGADGATGVGLALPAPGSPLGLGGPAAFSAAALEVEEAVVVPGAATGLVPERTGRAVLWRAYAAQRRQLPDVGEADRGLRAAMAGAVSRLVELDVARWRPEVADTLMNLRHHTPPPAPPGTPARCVELASSALQARVVVDLALDDDGGSVSAAEARARREALAPLALAARAALVAACSPEVWPPA